VLSRSADLPLAPSNKNYLLVAGLAVLLGLALGIGAALVREHLVEPIADRDKLEAALDARTLGVVPAVTPRMESRRSLAAQDSPDGPEGQAYLAMAAMLRTTVDGRPEVIAATGPARAEGKSRTTANLAVALAGSGSRVAAVSCDLRNPRLHELFDRGNEVGLTTLLTGRTSLADTIQVTAVDDVFLIASGPVADNSAELLGGEAMGRLLDTLRTGFDFVLIDTGPGLEMADVLLLAPRVDGFVVVADAAATSRSNVTHLRSRLESAGGRIIGGVLTNVARSQAERFGISVIADGVRDRARRGLEAARTARGGRAPQPRVSSSDETSPAADTSTSRTSGPTDGPAATSADGSGPHGRSDPKPASGSKTQPTTSRSKPTTSKSATASRSRSPATPRPKPRSTSKTTASAPPAPTSSTKSDSATPQRLRTPPPPDGTDGGDDPSTNGEAAKSPASASTPSPSGPSDEVSPGGRSDETRARPAAAHRGTSPSGKQQASEATSKTTSGATVTEIEPSSSEAKPSEEAMEAADESSQDGEAPRSSDAAASPQPRTNAGAHAAEATDRSRSVDAAEPVASEHASDHDDERPGRATNAGERSPDAT
jgi:capsular exopolysaccharide synthesis family protein